MRSLHEFWKECQERLWSMQAVEPCSQGPFGQLAAVVYTGMEWMEEERRKHARSNDKDDRNLVVRIDGMGKPDRDVVGRVRNEHGEGVQEEARGGKKDKGGQGQEGCEESAAEEQAMSDLCHMRKMERGRVLYCLDYIMRSLNDEDAQEVWLEEGCEDGLITDRNFLTEDQVEYHADLVDSQQELDGFVALAAKILFSEVYPKAWSLLSETSDHNLKELMTPEMCILT